MLVNTIHEYHQCQRKSLTHAKRVTISKINDNRWQGEHAALPIIPTGPETTNGACRSYERRGSL